MIDALATAIRERRPFRNAALIGECVTYVVDDKGGTGASGTTCDDLVMATAVAEMPRRYEEPAQQTVWLAEELGLQGAAVDARYQCRGGDALMPFAEPVTEQAAGGCAHDQVSVSSTATLVLGANAARAHATVRNVGATDCYVGSSSAVTTSTGMLLTSAGKDAFDITWTGTVYAITASSTTTLAYWDESS